MRFCVRFSCIKPKGLGSGAPANQVIPVPETLCCLARSSSWLHQALEDCGTDSKKTTHTHVFWRQGICASKPPGYACLGGLAAQVFIGILKYRPSAFRGSGVSPESVWALCGNACGGGRVRLQLHTMRTSMLPGHPLSIVATPTR